MSTKPEAHITFTYFYRFAGIFYFMSSPFGSFSRWSHATAKLQVKLYSMPHALGNDAR
jgi:hypothetical protein